MIDLLKWDTDFFGIKTGKIDINTISENEFIRIFNKAKKEKYDLFYCYIPPENKSANEIAEKYNGFLADEKITYFISLDLIKKGEKSENIVPYKKKAASEDLIELSIQSGEYSRFKTDKKFSENQFEKLYAEWIIKSVNKKISDEVFVYFNKNKIVGMITIKLENNCGKIGLIAVNNNFRGKSIGSQLLNHVFNFCRSYEIEKLEVITQLKNKNACHFYEKNGFQIKHIVNVYHFWL